VAGVDGDPFDGLRRVVAFSSQRRHPLTQREGLTDGDIGPAESATLGAGEADQPAEVLGALTAAARLRGHPGDLVELVIDDRDRDEHDVGAITRLRGVGEIAQDAMHGWAEFAGAGATSLDGPGQVGPALHEVGDVGAQGEPIDRNLLGLPLDEDDPRAADHSADDRQVKVGAAEGEQRREPARGHDVGQDPAVEVRAVREDDGQAVLPIKGLEPRHVLLVDEDIVSPHDPGAKFVPGLGGAGVMGRDHLAQVLGSLGADRANGQVMVGGIPLQRGGQPRVGEQRLDVGSGARHRHHRLASTSRR
jgi:hypothetical protein